MRNITHILVLTAALLFTGCTSTIEEGDLGSLPYFDLETDNISVDGNAQSVTVGINTNRELTVSNKTDWIGIIRNEKDLVFEIDQNTEFDSRTAEIIISIADGMISKTLTVTQSATGIPQIGVPEVTGFTNTELHLSATVLNPGEGGITARGFLIGTDSTDMTDLPGTMQDNTVTATASGLTPSTRYYIAAYIENHLGRSTTHTISHYTGGAPLITDSSLVDVSSGYGELTISATMEFPGTIGTVYGTIVGTDPEVTLETAVSTTSHEYTDNSLSSVSWTDTHYGLKQGLGYYYRAYAVNEYGTVYGETGHSYTQGNPDMTQYRLTVDLNPTAYEGRTDLIDLRLTDLFTAYFRDDISGSGNWTGNYYNSSDTTYTFDLYSGRQTVAYSNISPNDYNIECEEKENELVRYSIKENYALYNILYAVENLDLQQDITTAPEFHYATSYIDLEMTYTDANGNRITDISSVIQPEANVTISGLSSDCAVLTDGSVIYEGEQNRTVNSYDETAGDVRSLGNTTVFPSNGRGITFSVTLNMNDGTAKTIECGYGPIERGRYYRIRLNLLEVSYENGIDFELEVIEDINEDIEIEF